ncbi:hypothetical protein H5410_044208 [Solanum commersonii]|uniref:Uncharacterized protein n=1 Tax=Solanum commersonii TaxID=4109 RepID=A0A9J5X936_SOLCO|nr:hypothetical protein H5410_044208 [Solanum commersonii]
MAGANRRACHKGKLLASELAIVPVTTLPERRKPPRMSCMKKENMEWSATGLASVAPELAIAGTPPDVAVAPAGVATGAASLTGAAQYLLCQQEGLLRQQGPNLVQVQSVYQLEELLLQQEW